MHNMKIRQALLEARLKHYELAEMMGISEFTLSRKLRKELPEEEQETIISMIKNYGKE